MAKTKTEEPAKEPMVINSAVARQAIESDLKNRAEAAMVEIQNVLKRHRCTLGAKIHKVEISKGVWADSPEVMLTAND